MAARKRGRAESFKAYRRKLKAEDAKLKRRLLGRVLWPGYFGTAYKKLIYGKPYLQNDQHTIPLT